MPPLLIESGPQKMQKCKPELGVEPRTSALQVQCSTTKLSRQAFFACLGNGSALKTAVLGSRGLPARVLECLVASCLGLCLGWIKVIKVIKVVKVQCRVLVGSSYLLSSCPLASVILAFEIIEKRTKCRHRLDFLRQRKKKKCQASLCT